MHYKTLFLPLLALLTLHISCSGDDKDPEIIKSSEKKILKYSVIGSTGVINESDKTITIDLSSYPDITEVRPYIEISDKATISPASEDLVDFSNPVKYTVTAEDGSKQVYTATAQFFHTDCFINKFFILGREGTFSFNDRTKITVLVPHQADLTRLIPDAEISEGATIHPSLGVETDFTNPVEYVVTSENKEFKKTYTVQVVQVPFDFRIDSISTTKVRAAQILDIIGTFAEKEESMNVFLIDGNGKETKCSIWKYTPSFIRMTVDKDLPVGEYDLKVSYYNSYIEEAIIYPEKIELTDVYPTVSFVSTSRLDPATDDLFIVGENFTPQKETKATIRFTDRDEMMELGAKTFYLKGTVYRSGDKDIIRVEGLNQLEESKSYNCTVIIDGVISKNVDIIDIRKNPTRPQILSISNTNPAVGETVTLTGKRLGSAIVFYAQVVDGSNMYLPVMYLGDQSWQLINGIDHLSFRMPKFGNVTKYKLKVTYYSVESEFSEVITLK
ncbi:DUF5018 domain-containing protein [Parabacteroides sp. PF5-9]|uniref:DUF5018 domain-containing protein n=1 Tax=Parabacteroides sp. PF5-9 TaxID=1742404 RepID=UPI00247496F7|nr:DUF5018 domain-containing protein [Parabacteroides sp. PF5-9]